MIKNKSGSILIWSVIMIGFVSFSFMYISGMIERSIKTDFVNFGTNVGGYTTKTIYPTNFTLFTGDDDFEIEVHDTDIYIRLIDGGPIKYTMGDDVGYLYENQKNKQKRNIRLNDFNGSIKLENIGNIAHILVDPQSEDRVLLPYYVKKEEMQIDRVSFIRRIFKIN